MVFSSAEQDFESVLFGSVSFSAVYGDALRKRRGLIPWTT